MEHYRSQVDTFCRQFLQLEAKPALPCPSALKLQEIQDAIYTRLFAEGTVLVPPPPRYQVRILKELVHAVEQSIDDWDEQGVSDELMSALSVLMASPIPSEDAAVQQKAYVTYTLSLLARGRSDDPIISLLENRSLIYAAGTTGLRTWEAALHLGQYLCKHPEIIKGRRVLELGAGTGYLSILCAKHLESPHVIASDGADEVVYNLPENLFLNGLQQTAMSNTSGAVQPMDVKWGWPLLGTEEDKWNGGRPLDVVLGADITYDSSVIPQLIATLTDLFGLYPAVEMYIAATQRNEQTFQTFLDQCHVHRLAVENVHYPIPRRDLQDGPFYSDQVPIRICRISTSPG